MGYAARPTPRFAVGNYVVRQNGRRCRVTNVIESIEIVCGLGWTEPRYYVMEGRWEVLLSESELESITGTGDHS